MDDPNWEGYTPLSCARTQGVPVVEVLLAAGAVVTGQGTGSPLSPVVGSDADTCQLLLSAGAYASGEDGGALLASA